MVECIVHKYIVYKCIVYSVSFGTQLKNVVLFMPGQ